MTIPVMIKGASFSPGEISEDVSIQDLAPTIAELLEAKPAEEWEGKSLLWKD